MILSLDFASDMPIYLQIRHQIVNGIAEGKLSPGEQLPTIRALSADTGINMMTISKAYQLLRQEGYILTDRRHGAMVMPAPPKDGTLPERTIASLRLAASEAKLHGLSLDAFLSLCSDLYEAKEDTP